MARLLGLAAVSWLAIGCAEPIQNRVREFNDDGVLLYSRGQYPEARDTFVAAVSLKPGDANLQFNLGQCYDRLGQFELAEKTYGACLKINPNHNECRHALAEMLWRQHRRDDAARMIEEWLAREPKLAAAYAEHGWLWRQLGNLPCAKSRLQQALELDPHDLRALVELGQIYEEENRQDRAVYLYERALEIQPAQPELLMRLTSLHQQGVGRPKPD
jgi:Flp pilus assembly protein TadD